MKKLLLSSLLLANGVAAAAPFVVKDIRVDGVLPETGAVILSTLPVKIGQTATDNDVANIVKQLYAQNRFDDVSALREGNTLVIKIVEFPIISNIKFEGNKAIPKEAIEQNLKANLISKGEIYDAERVEAFRQGLLEHYHAMGRYTAQVEKVISSNNGHTDIQFTIDEGEMSYVKEINFEGNNVFSGEELTKRLDIQPDVSWWNIFESSKFEQQAFQQDIDTIRDFYLDQGYAKFSLEDTKVDFSDDKKDVFLTYQINEGEQYTISEIRIVGNTARMDRELLALLKDFQVGQQFRKTDLITIEEGIKQVLGNNGFGSAKVEIYPTYNDEEHTVRVTFLVDADQRLYVRKIRFEGNDVTSDSTLRREMRQQEGAWLSTGLVALGKSRLERTGFYESVEMSMPSVPGTNDQVDVVYKIKERNTGSINFGIGYGSESGISYQAGIKQDNFLGMGSTISLNGTRNDYGTTINLGYTEPYFTKDGVSLGGNLFYEDYDNSKSDSQSNYKRTTYGLNGTLGFPVDEYNSYYLGLGYTHDKITNAERELNREKYVKAMDFDFDESSNQYSRIKTDDFDFSFGWNFNSFNRGYLPTEGSSANIGGRVTAPGSDNKYYKLNADFRNYYPLNRAHRWVLSTRASVGYGAGFGGKEMPFYQNYTAGGIGSLRGFSYGSIGPKAIYRDTDTGVFSRRSADSIGGNAIATASIELITPTPFVSEKYQHNVRTSLFIDAATVWNTKWKQSEVLGYYQSGEALTAGAVANENFKNWKRVRASAGVGFQWLSPIGPLSFSYARPIRSFDGDDIERFQFSIGSSF